MMGLGELKLEVKKVWQVIVTMLIMISWATFLNKIVFREHGSNYFYLEMNMLPGNIGGKYFFFVYAIIFFLFIPLARLFRTQAVSNAKMTWILFVPGVLVRAACDGGPCFA